jgi:hypothetical protein
VLHQTSRRQRKYIALADPVPFEKLEVSLFAALPSRDGLESIDVPADHTSQALGAALGSGDSRGVFELDLAMSGPGERRGAMGEGLRFAVNNRLSLSDSDDRRVPSEAVRLLSSADVSHADLGGDTLFLSRIRRLRNS